MVLLESSEGRKRAPWMLQLVFNKILTFPFSLTLTNFGLRNMAAVVVGKGGRGWGQAPPPVIYIKGTSLLKKNAETMHG